MLNILIFIIFMQLYKLIHGVFLVIQTFIIFASVVYTKFGLPVKYHFRIL